MDGNADRDGTDVTGPRLRRTSFRWRRTDAPTLDHLDGTDRRSFLRRSGGYAASAALVGVPTAVVLESEAAAAAETPRTTANPTAPPPVGPTMAYVHNVKEGTVVIVSGETQRTVRDRALVHKLLNAPAVKKPKTKPKRKTTSTKRKAG
ncbi:MAG: hypothetical protein Q7T55_25870 [Solirubrobacteraceae bacterium]|nr:hypothetical protein [Solirubrobacteraceae bacterium]